MKSNINRRKDIFKGVVPPVGTDAHKTLVDHVKATESPESKAFSKKSWEKVNRSLEAQYLSNCDLVTEHSLRNYLTEFNNRVWQHGLRSMPTMFNIMEAFFIYRKPEMYFELIEEENYLISYFDFIDFVTSSNFKENQKIILENLTQDIVYNFNVGKDLDEITFKSDDKDEFIVAGVSIIRRENEATILMTTGRKKTEELSIDKSSFKFDSPNPDKAEIIKEAKESLSKDELEYEYLDEEKQYVKVLVACRVDLDSMTIDARYVAEETTLMFNITTDEIDGFLNGKGEFILEDIKRAYQNSLEKIEVYNPIFEAIKMSLFLPYYFNLNEDSIIEEDHDTEFKKVNSNPVKKRRFRDTFGFKCSIKPLFILDMQDAMSADKIRLRDDLFKVQSKGYWKKLEFDEVGLDKNGNPLHGKTWVNENLSWFEAKEKDLVIEKESPQYVGGNAGFIYILRNPTMEADIFKIGLTRNSVDERVKQLSKTSVPDKFYKSQEWNVKNCVRAEKEIHTELNDFRIDPRREFFKVQYDKAIATIKNVIDRINKE